MFIESSVRLITAITLLNPFLLLTFDCAVGSYRLRFAILIATCGCFLVFLFDKLIRFCLSSVWGLHLLPCAIVPCDFDSFDPLKFFLFVHCQFANLLFLVEFINLFNNFIVRQLWDHVRGFQGIIKGEFVLKIYY